MPDKALTKVTESLLNEMPGGWDFYAAQWEVQPWIKKKWYTLRGLNPGGRKGAPPLREA